MIVNRPFYNCNTWRADISQVSAIQDAVKDMRKPMIQNSRQASQEIIGNRPYREIQNRQFMISPLTPDKYHKIEPKLYERGAEFSGLIRDGKVMFTTEKEDAPHFQAILRQTICENQILENLQNMGLDNQQIQALSSSIEIAARNNMANVIENYVSKDYDITQLGTMNDLLIGYLDQSDSSQFLDNSRQLDLLLSAKQEFDLQIAQREEQADVRRAVRARLILLAQRAGEQGVHAHARAAGKGDAQRLERECERHGVHCVLTELCHKDAVHHVVERLKQHGYHHRHRHAEEQPADRHGAHFIFL